MEPTTDRPLALDTRPARAVFAELVAGALAACRLEPTPEARAYLGELLWDHLAADAPHGAPGEETLGETLLRARLERGPRRLGRMRVVGDRALFASGFFGDRYARCEVDLDYVRDVGRVAYADLARGLAAGARVWARLYEELAECFVDFADALAEIAEAGRCGPPVEVLRIYERFLRTGSRRDRRRLLRLGHLPPFPGSAERQ